MWNRKVIRKMMDEKWTPLEKKLLGGILLLGIIVIGLLFLFMRSSNSDEEIPLPAYQIAEEPSEKVEKGESNELVVDVKGAVKNPGIYRLPSEARMMDAITEAGGASKEADLDRVNLAAPLSDGMAIYIPKKGEENLPIPGVEAGGEGSQGGKININTAGIDELQQLNGIGPSKAEAILRYREENGPFSTVEELTNVPGIGEKTLENLREQVTVR